MRSLKMIQITLLLVVLFFSIYNCRNYAHFNESDETKWIINNENKINSELSKIISRKIKINESNPLWIEKSFVVTEFDTTILGDFAKRIKNLNGCFEVMYTYSRVMEKQKRITIIKDTSDHCLDITKPFSLIDSTRYLKISFDTLY